MNKIPSETVLESVTQHSHLGIAFFSTVTGYALSYFVAARLSDDFAMLVTFSIPFVLLCNFALFRNVYRVRQRSNSNKLVVVFASVVLITPACAATLWLMPLLVSML